MKNEKILSLIVVLLVLVVGFQGYYLYKLNTVQTTVKKEIVIAPKVNTLGDANPFEEFHQMQKEMEKMFNSMSSNFSAMPEFEKFFDNISIAPSLNIEDLNDKYEVSVNLPGSNKQDIKIGITKGILKIEAKTGRYTDSNSSNFIKKEIFEGSFIRSLILPNDAGDEFKSKFENGVLKITIPKKS